MPPLNVILSVGDAGYYWTSLDHGLTFTERNLSGDIHAPDAYHNFYGVIFDGAIFIIISSDGHTNNHAFYISVDGLNLVLAGEIADSYGAPNDIAFDGTYYYIAGCDNANHYQSIFKTADFITFTKVYFTTIYAGTSAVGVACGPGAIVAALYSNNNNLIVSTDAGATWTPIILPEGAWTYQVTAISFANGLFIMTGYYGSNPRIYTSPDGINWTKRLDTGTPAQYNKVYFANGLFFAASGYYDYVIKSGDGITWTIGRINDDSPYGKTLLFDSVNHIYLTFGQYTDGIHAGNHLF